MMQRPTAILLAALLLAGCASRDRSSAAPGQRTGAAREIPAGAQLVATGRPPLSFLFPRGGGKVYLYDQTDDSLLFTADLSSGDTNSGLLILDAERRAFVGRDVNTDPSDDVVLLKPIEVKHRFAIYFERAQYKVEAEGDDDSHEQLKVEPKHVDGGHGHEAAPKGPAPE